MKRIDQHIIKSQSTLSVALKMLDELGEDLTLFVINESGQLVGTLTDGDIRRGMLQGYLTSNIVEQFMEPNFRYLKNGKFKVSEVTEARNLGIGLLPVIDDDKKILRLISLSESTSCLPLDVVIMAGGEGMRLRPLTEKTPKPLLKIGDKPIIEHVIDRLVSFGIENIHISVNYLGEQIENYFGDGSSKGIHINYIHEDTKLGTIGAVSKVNEYKNDFVLVMNSDLLTNIDYEDFFNEFELKNADFTVATTPYNVNIPYAILETENENILSFKEKPTFTYYSNAGIYLVKRKHLEKIPKDSFFNATDFIDLLIKESKKVTYYPILGYWLDIGQIDDFNKAQKDIHHIKL
jgi:dTDP-glucose pyrophosphorylase